MEVHVLCSSQALPYFHRSSLLIRYRSCSDINTLFAYGVATKCSKLLGRTLIVVTKDLVKTFPPKRLGNECTHRWCNPGLLVQRCVHSVKQQQKQPEVKEETKDTADGSHPFVIQRSVAKRLNYFQRLKSPVGRSWVPTSSTYPTKATTVDYTQTLSQRLNHKRKPGSPQRPMAYV